MNKARVNDLPESDRVAKVLGCSPIEVHNAKQQWSANRIMREVITQRIGNKIQAARTALETIAPADLQKQQGEISGLRAALSLILKEED